MVVLASPAGADPENGLIYEGQQCYGYEGQAAYSAIEGYEMLCNDGYPNGSVDPPIWIGNVY
jgi:hypothetical protein